MQYGLVTSLHRDATKVTPMIISKVTDKAIVMDMNYKPKERRKKNDKVHSENT